MNKKLKDILGTTAPLIQAPMAGHQDADLVIAVCKAGGLGSLPCASISTDKIRKEVVKIRSFTSAPFNLNFFCHSQPDFDQNKEDVWKKSLENYYIEFGIALQTPSSRSSRNPFDEESCQLIEDLKPHVVSFHFGLPDSDFIIRIKNAGVKIIASATTLSEALWLEENGCDAIIAQGVEAGGHRSMFLTTDISTQVGTMALVTQIVDAVKIPVIASGGIGDQRGIEAALALGASGVQIGSVYLLTPEAKISEIHRKALKSSDNINSALTNIFTGKPARGIMNRVMREMGPMSQNAPEFPYAGGALSPLKIKSEAVGSGDFSSLWAGQAVYLAREVSAEILTREFINKWPVYHI